MGDTQIFVPKILTERNIKMHILRDSTKKITAENKNTEQGSIEQTENNFKDENMNNIVVQTRNVPNARLRTRRICLFKNSLMK